jgi:DegV family protein with EDD domain
MAKVRIITDVTAYLEPDLVEQYQVTLLPVDIRFGQDNFRIEAGENWDRFYEYLAKRPAQMAEITVSGSAFQEAYTQLNRETEEILVIPSSSQLSSAHAEARTAARNFLGRCRIVVMDSMSISWGLGMLVKSAAREAAAGRSLDEVVRFVRGMLPHIYFFFFAEQLDYLERGRRISPAQALLGTMLRIKPLLLVEDGDIVPLEKVRTREAAVEKLADFVAEFASIQQVVILKSPVESEIGELVGELHAHLSSALPGQRFEVIEYDPVLACHLGPEALGVVVYEGM